MAGKLPVSRSPLHSLSRMVEAWVNSAANSNRVSYFEIPPSDPPTQAEVRWLAAKVNGVIAALRALVRVGFSVITTETVARAML